MEIGKFLVSAALVCWPVKLSWLVLSRRQEAKKEDAKDTKWRNVVNNWAMNKKNWLFTLPPVIMEVKNGSLQW